MKNCFFLFVLLIGCTGPFWGNAQTKADLQAEIQTALAQFPIAGKTSAQVAELNQIQSLLQQGQGITTMNALAFNSYAAQAEQLANKFDAAYSSGPSQSISSGGVVASAKPLDKCIANCLVQRRRRLQAARDDFERFIWNIRAIHCIVDCFLKYS